MPYNMIQNMRATLPGKSVRKLMILLCLAITVQVCYNVQAHRTLHACEPHRHPEPIPDNLPHPAGDFEQKPQAFLAGATFNPEYLEPDVQPVEDAPEETGFTVIVNGKPIKMSEVDATNAQIMLAKNEALEGMNQLADLGRKLLHKHHDKDDDHHHDDDDDEEDDDADDDDHDDDDKSIKQAKTFDARKEEEDDHHQHHGPHHPKPGHGHAHCKRHERVFMALLYLKQLCWVGVVVYGYRVRKTMRQVLNIKGSKFKDCLAWVFCTPCAVCQETRTITKNNVSNGTWHNPTLFVSPVPQKIAEQPSTKLPV